MPFTSIDQAFGYIESFTNFEKTTPTSVREYKLERMEQLLGLFGNPHRSMKTVHIAGSKGKGSTAAFLTSFLTEAGWTTGLYTSPHVLSYKERITVCGNQLDDELLVRCIERIRHAVSGGSDRVDRLNGFDEEAPTTFELLTLLAFLAFRETDCSWAVIETGIGGRLDATNVVTPQACVLTPVELEHTDILGTTIEEIAFEKAGIIKKNTPVFCGYQQEAVETVFRNTATRRKAPLRFLRDELRSFSTHIQKQRTGYETVVRYKWKDGTTNSGKIHLLGDVQAENAALAVISARYIFERDLPQVRTEAVITAGLERTVVLGRMELVRDNPPVLLDGAHTPASVERLITSVNNLFPGEKILIFGSVTGKDHRTMADLLAPHFEEIIISTPGTFKKSNPEEVFSYFSSVHKRCKLIASPEEALDEALKRSRRIPSSTPSTSAAVIVTGSFYMIAEIKNRLA